MSDSASSVAATVTGNASGASSGIPSQTNALSNASSSVPRGIGKGGKGLGKAGAKRFNKKHKYDTDPLLALTKGKIRQICQRSGIKRISGLVYEEIRKVVNDYTREVLGYALCYTKHRRKETLIATDVVYGTRSSKAVNDLYGFDDPKQTARGNLTGKGAKVQ